MAKKKAKPPPQETVEDLAELAGKLNLVDDALEGDLRDACDSEADLIFEGIKDSVMLDKLQFLYEHGYKLSRLRELIEQARLDE